MSDANDVHINAPDTEDFKPQLDLKDMMGTWYVTHSTLPMWKSKKDVTITYALLPPKPGAPASEPARLDDVVEFRARTDPRSKPRRRIVGVDTAVPPRAGAAPTRFKWRGRGWLVVASSRWQLLGYRAADVSAPAWAVTFFEKTLFTPAGVDVYARTATGLPEELYKLIREGVKGLGGQVGALAEELFEVEHER